MYNLQYGSLNFYELLDAITFRIHHSAFIIKKDPCFIGMYRDQLPKFHLLRY